MFFRGRSNIVVEIFIVNCYSNKQFLEFQKYNFEYLLKLQFYNNLKLILFNYDRVSVLFLLD